MKNVIVMSAVMALSGCSLMDRYTASVPTESVTTVYQGPSSPVKPSAPGRSLTCQKIQVNAAGATVPVEAYQPQVNVVELRGKEITFLAGGILSEPLTFALEPMVVTETQKTAMGWSGNFVAEFIATKDHPVVFVLHRYNTPVDKSYNGVTHNLNLVSHVYLSGCQ